MVERGKTSGEGVEQRAKPTISSWEERGLKSFRAPKAFGEDRLEEVGKIAKIILSGGTEDSGFQQLISTEEDFWKVNKECFNQAEKKELLVSAHKQRGREFLNIRGRFFDEIVSVFSQEKQVLDSNETRRALNLAVYALSPEEMGEGWFDGFEIARKYYEQPLAYSVGDLKRLAYREGIYLDPLEREMDRRIGEELDRNHIADVVQKSLDDDQARRWLNLHLDGDESWFIIESLFAVSTVNDRGDYTTEDKDIRSYDIGELKFVNDMKRKPEVVERLIAHLRKPQDIS